jgi:thiamine biosynthesis lipoprotein
MNHISKKIMALICYVLTLMQGCSVELSPGSFSKYSYEFLGAFDTAIQFMGYARNEREFADMARLGEDRFMELHRLFDIYNDYDGINNIKTINDNAGVKPVTVDSEIIDLILFSKEWHRRTGGAVNIALGSVLGVWHFYREIGLSDPASAMVPPIDKLREAAKHTDIDKVIVDERENTVYLEDRNMRLDVGAVAKGYATELVARELREKGYDSFIISSGGNVRVEGKPADSSRSKWGIGIQDPAGNPLNPDDTPLDTAFIDRGSVVSSGDYQRYYIVNGKRYHHIIDPESLMPADHFRAVTIYAADSGEADFLSTTVFILPYDQGLKLVQSLDGVEALWIMPDGTIEATDGMKKMLKKMGGASNK